MQNNTMRGVPFTPREVVRIAIVGLGSRGRSLLRDLLGIEGVEIVALCEPDPTAIGEALSLLTESGRPQPALFYGTPTEFTRLCNSLSCDMVYIVTPWESHVSMAVEAMEAGLHVGLEVPAATTLEGCWQLVETSERTRRHCVLLENCLYGYEEMLLLRLAQSGRLGTLVHGSAGYIHYLCPLLFQPQRGDWRRTAHQHHNRNHYPTHGLAVIAKCMGIHAGDRFTQLVSMSTKEASLSEYRDATLLPEDPRRQEQYACGDRNTSLLQTAQGRTVVLEYSIVSPHPYTRGTHLQGTKGAFQGFPPGVFFIDSPNHSAWEPLGALKAEFEDPLWTQFGEQARQTSGHGGMDFIMNWRLMQCLRGGLVPDIDVYDAVAWSAPSPLSELSITQGSTPITFPDFTRGHWKEEQCE
jgi:predicted dehydrogenase